MSTAKASSDERIETEETNQRPAGVQPPPPSRLHQALGLFRFAMGMLFVALGIIGSLLPVMQGWIFFLLALVMFFPDDPRVEKVLVKATPKFPKLVRFLRRMGVGVQDTTPLAMIDVIHPHHHHDATDRPDPAPDSSS